MARFCSDCGHALHEGERFCTSCGSRAVVEAAVAAAPATPAPAPAASPPVVVAKKGGPALPIPLILGALAALGAYWLLGSPASAIVAFALVAVLAWIVGGIVGLFLGLLFRRGIAVALVTALVMGSCGYAAAAYAQGPDFRGIGVPAQRDIARYVPFLRPSGKLSPKDAELERLRTAASAATRQAATAASAQLTTIKQKLVAARLPVLAVSRERTEGGEAVLAVGLDLERLAGPLSTTGGVVETFSSMVRIAQIKDLDLKGLQHVSVGVLDGSRRLIFSMAAPVASIEGFRAGTLKQDQFIGSLAFRGENRLAMVDAIRRIVAK